MLTPEDRFYCWENYKQRIRELFNDVDDDLIYRFAPYNKPEDKDTHNVKAVRNILEKLYDFVDEHYKVLDEEFAVYDMERSNSQVCFLAWCYGLCPNVLKENNLLWTMDYEHIAKFKQSQNISREDTQQAIELWRQKNLSRSA